MVDELISKLYWVFLQVQSQNSKLQTYEETMMQLDEVFTKSSTGSEAANQMVA